MDDLFTTLLDSTPVPIAVTPRAIAKAVRPPLPRAMPGGDDDVLRTWVNDERNSRIVPLLGTAPPPKFQVRWQAPLADAMTPVCLLRAADRIVLQGEMTWQLFQRDGKPLAAAHLGRSGVTLDPARGLFYAADASGLLAARALRDGQPLFALSLNRGDDFHRTFVARRHRMVLTLSTRMPTSNDLPEPEHSTIEITDLRDSRPQKSWDQEDGPYVLHDLERKSAILMGALHGNTLAVTTQKRIYLLDFELKFRQALTGDFVPISLSLDEAGRIYVVVRSGDRQALWLVTPEGERLYAYDFPPGLSSPSVPPPIVGYDHTAYLLVGQRILAVDPAGKLRWSRPTSGRIAGAVVTPDDRLLVAEGSHIVAWDTRGDHVLVHSFPGEEMATEPVLTNERELLVATRSRLYCLVRAR